MNAVTTNQVDTIKLIIALVLLIAGIPVGLWGVPLAAGGGAIADDALAGRINNRSTTNYWTGEGMTTSWNNPDNWLSGVPVDKQHVAITGSADIVTIEAPCASLASFTMRAGTMTFTNWTTCLRAETVELRGGTFTLPPPFVNNAMSNRVHVQCHDFTLSAGAKIDVTARGFAGGKVTGNGPGGQAGASYGGTRLAFGFPAAYGSAYAPTDPGSGGGSLNNKIIGGAGGGAVWIEASGTVAIYGSITSDGRGGNAIHSSGGTGGSIYITCNRIEGSESGLLSACGARGSYRCQGGGSGGRIAVVYNTLAQAHDNPGVRFTAAGGLWAATGYGQYADWPDRRCNEQGTLYCSDTSFLAAGLRSGQFKGVTFMAEGFTNWTPSSLIVSNGTDVAFHHDDGFTLHVSGDIRVDQATLGVYGSGGLVCGGDLHLTGISQLRIYSTATNALDIAQGTPVAVVGHLTIDANSKMYLISPQADGSAFFLRINRLYIAPEGGIDTTAMKDSAGCGQERISYQLNSCRARFDKGLPPLPLPAEYLRPLQKPRSCTSLHGEQTI